MKAASEVNADSPLYALVIDEMNRANLPRVFGELMYLFEYRAKRIRLQYSEEFALPPNLRFIGTMNTADRSIRSIDIALRRRFDVFELRPDAGVLQRYFERNELNVGRTPKRATSAAFLRPKKLGANPRKVFISSNIRNHHASGAGD